MVVGLIDGRRGSREWWRAGECERNGWDWLKSGAGRVLDGKKSNDVTTYDFPAPPRRSVVLLVLAVVQNVKANIKTSCMEDIQVHWDVMETRDWLRTVSDAAWTKSPNDCPWCTCRCSRPRSSQPLRAFWSRASSFVQWDYHPGFSRTLQIFAVYEQMFHVDGQIVRTVRGVQHQIGCAACSYGASDTHNLTETRLVVLKYNNIGMNGAPFWGLRS